MKDEIRVGEFVRTSEGYIGKYKKNGLVKHTCEIEDNEMSWITGKYNIVKHSFNIIDLIQVGDYVNGEYIIQISKTFGFLFCETTYYDEITGEEKHNFIKKEDIRTILTKEQFEANVYKLEKK